MLHDSDVWEELEETGLRLWEEGVCSLSSAITVAAWDSSDVEAKRLLVCNQEGSVLMYDGPGEEGECLALGVYLCTVPVPLSATTTAPQFTSTAGKGSERKLSVPWSLVQSIPCAGDSASGAIAFVQGRRTTIMLSTLPGNPDSLLAPLRPQELGGKSIKGAKRRLHGSAFLDGCRVALLEGHKAQIRCLSVDTTGCLLISGDEEGTVCVWQLQTPTSTFSNDQDRNVYATHTKRHKRRLRARSHNTEEECSALSYYCVKVMAHTGPVFAIAHIPGIEIEGENAVEGTITYRFVTGSVNGSVRLWEVRLQQAPGNDVTENVTDTAANERSEDPIVVNLQHELHVGGCQVTCLATTLGEKGALISVGTLEGIIWVFTIGNHDEEISESNKAPEPHLQHLLEHSACSIAFLAFSNTENIAVAADASGAVRVYRIPTSPDHSGVSTERWRLVAECQLGSPPTSCCFSPMQSHANTHTHTSTQTNNNIDSTKQERLLACSSEGLLKVWLTSELPHDPPEKTPIEPKRSGSIISATSTSSSTDDTAVEERKVTEEREERSEERNDPVEGEVEARPAPVPLPVPQPPAVVPRDVRQPTDRKRVQFDRHETSPTQPTNQNTAPSDTVTNHHTNIHIKKNSTDMNSKHVENRSVPEPMAPPNRPKLRQTWGKHTHTTRTHVHTHADTHAHGTGTGEDHAKVRGGEVEAGSVFVPPSILATPAILSTTVLQNKLEAISNQKFDPKAAAKEWEVGDEGMKASKRAASMATTVHPAAVTFYSLAPVSLPEKDVNLQSSTGKSTGGKGVTSTFSKKQVPLGWEGMEPTFKPNTGRRIRKETDNVGVRNADEKLAAVRSIWNARMPTSTFI